MHLFFFRTQFYFIQAATVLFIGFMIILTVSFYYNIHYFYGKKSKYITLNLRKFKQQPTILLISIVIRPII